MCLRISWHFTNDIFIFFYIFCCCFFCSLYFYFVLFVHFHLSTYVCIYNRIILQKEFLFCFFFYILRYPCWCLLLLLMIFYVIFGVWLLLLLFWFVIHEQSIPPKKAQHNEITQLTKKYKITNSIYNFFWVWFAFMYNIHWFFGAIWRKYRYTYISALFRSLF